MQSQSTQEKEKAVKYNRIKLRIRLIGIVFTIAFLTLFQWAVSPGLKQAIAGISQNFYITLLLYVTAFCVLFYIFELPLRVIGGFSVEHKFNLSEQPLSKWFEDDIKSALLSLVFFLIFIGAFYFFLRVFPATWWLLTAFFYFLATVVIARITPIVIIPLFFKYSPVEGGLKESIIELSEKCGISVLNVLKINFSSKTKKLNAALTGMGKSRRVILADNLIDNFTVDEVKGVLAHEFGHYKHLHIWKLLAFGFFSIFVSFYILYLLSIGVVDLLGAGSIYDIKIFPALMLILFLTGFALLPLQNGFSRILEREADAFSLKVTDKDTFITLMQKLGDYNLADPNPSKLVKFIFYSHPPISERIKFAQE